MEHKAQPTTSPPTRALAKRPGVGGKAVSPYKRPSSPESQTVVVINGFLGQGYKHPGHPAALSLAPYLRRLPAGDGKGGTGQGKGRQGPGGLQAGRPGFPKLILQRKMQERKRWQKSPTRPPGTKERKGGQNAARGTPPTQRKQNATKREEPRKNRQNVLGVHLVERVEPSEVGVQRGRAQHAKTKTRRQKTKKDDQQTHLLSSVSPPQPCRPKRKKVVVTAHPPGGPPKPLIRQTP